VALVVCQARVTAWPVCTAAGVAERNAVGAGGTTAGGAAGGVGPPACCTSDFDPPPQPASRIKGNKNLSLTFLLARLLLRALAELTLRNRDKSPVAGTSFHSRKGEAKRTKVAGGDSKLGKKYCHPETLTIGETPYRMAKRRITAGVDL
jgi:hypothetical protein